MAPKTGQRRDQNVKLLVDAMLGNTNDQLISRLAPLPTMEDRRDAPQRDVDPGTKIRHTGKDVLAHGASRRQDAFGCAQRSSQQGPPRAFLRLQTERLVLEHPPVGARKRQRVARLEHAWTGRAQRDEATE